MLSVRGVDRVLRVAWSLADLGGRDRRRAPTTSTTALSFRPVGARPMSDEAVQRAWAYLSRVAEPPCPELAALAADVGPVEAAAAVRSRLGVRSPRPAYRGPPRTGQCGKGSRYADRPGGRLVTPDDDEWPYLAFTAFGGVGGAQEAGRRTADGAVGAGPGAPRRGSGTVGGSRGYPGERPPTANMWRRISRSAWSSATSRWCPAAHSGLTARLTAATLAVDGTTVAVLAGGIDVPYPAGHSALLHRISATGLLVSEYPPGVRPARHRFLTRNRLVAVLVGATVVVEAGLRSGAANTASWADAMGRAVCAVPGPVTSAASAGCHATAAARRPADDAGRRDRGNRRPRGELADEPEHPVSRLDGLSEGERLVYEALPARGLRSVEQISVGSGLPVERVLGPLAMLEIAGLVEKIDGRWRLVRC